jgi:TolB-like protein/DNA-binding winged helix-turn-helix (wHTH) protein
LVSEDYDIVELGPFRLDTARRILTRDGRPLAISSRAFDILALLIEHRDRVMTKDEIIARVWRGVIVEENNLAVQVSALRRALGEADLDAPLILTVPGTGYRFVGPVSPGAREPAMASIAMRPPSALAANGERAVPALMAPARPALRWRTMAALLVGAAVVCGIAIVLLSPAATPPQPAPAVPPRLSIAVLPFRDLSDDRCCAYLADALTDDLTTDLAKIPGSVVIARESSDIYRDKSMPTARIGRELNVRYLLEGSLRAVDSNFSINAQLINAATAGHLWADHFEVPRNHLGEAQDAIVHRLASILGVQLIRIEGAASLRERASNPDALDLFFEARSILDRSDTLAAMADAEHLLDQAIAKQPDFGDGLGELAFLLARKLNGVSDETVGPDLAKARLVDAEALRVAPNSALAQAANGLLLSLAKRWGDARANLQAALVNDPESVPIRSALISCLNRLGEYEAAIRAVEELMRIDPEGQGIRERYYKLGFAHVMLGHPREGLDWLNRSTAGEPEPEPGADDLGRVEWAYLFRIAALQQLGQSSEAARELARYNRVWPYRSVWRLGSAFSRAQAATPGYDAFLRALEAAGLPYTISIDEGADLGVPPARAVSAHRSFEPTPAVLPPIAGLKTIRTPELRELLDGAPPPQIVNVGNEAVTLPHTVAGCEFDPSALDRARACGEILKQGNKAAPVIVMGRNIFDWDGYNGALELASNGVPGVRWYRGGEEAWFVAKGPSTDERK